MKSASHYIARIEAIRYFISKSDEDFLRFWRNGFVIPDYKDEFDKKVQELNKNKESKLSLVDLMTFNTWFEIHPEKVAGIEKMTTSRDFPIKLTGTKQNVIDAIERTITGDNEKIKRLRIAKAKIAIAMAKKKTL